MIEILSYGFMQRALLSGILISIICPMIGMFLVLRRMSMVGDALSHVALAGVAASFLIGTYPMIGSIVVTVLAALGIEKLRKSYQEYAEISIAIILSGGIGLAVVLIGLAKNINIDIMAYLFGSLSTINIRDTYVMAVLSLFIIIVLLYLYNQLFYISFDEAGARISGVKVERLNIFFTILIALTISISMRIVGILLVSSLMVIPVAIGIQLEKSFKYTMVASIIFAVFSTILGIGLSFHMELAPGGTIVLLNVMVLVIILVYKGLRKGKKEF